jgi:hypothetical protein
MFSIIFILTHFQNYDTFYLLPRFYTRATAHSQLNLPESHSIYFSLRNGCVHLAANSLNIIIIKCLSSAHTINRQHLPLQLCSDFDAGITNNFFLAASTSFRSLPLYRWHENHNEISSLCNEGKVQYYFITSLFWLSIYKHEGKWFLHVWTFWYRQIFIV